MAFTLETNGNNTFLVYSVQAGDTLDTMTLGMITNNRIPGIASMMYTQMNMEIFLKYNITAKVAVKQFFSGVVNKRRLLGVFSGITSVLSVVEEYMIDPNALLLDMDYIYVDVTTCNVEMICLPLMNVAGVMDIGMFFKNIMFTTQFDQTENCDYVARIINYLNSTPVFGVDDFGQLLRQLQAEPAAQVRYGQQVPLQQAQNVFVQPQVVNKGNSMEKAGIETAGANIGSGFNPSGHNGEGNAAASGQKSRNDFPVPDQKGESIAMPGKNGAVGFGMPGQNGGGAFSAFGKNGVNSHVVPGSNGADSRGLSGKNGMGSIAIPGQNGTSSVTGTEQQKETEQKKMSMFYLLQHYNKENAAIYKAQQEEKKNAGKSAVKNSKGKKSKEGMEVLGQGQKNGISIPAFGQNNGQNIQIPGQKSGMGIAMPAQNKIPEFQFPGQNSAFPTPGPQLSAQGSSVAQQLNDSGKQAIQQSALPKSAEENFGDTVIMEDCQGEETVVLGATQAVVKPYLIRSSNNEKILLEKAVFRIGKERNYVDYCVSGNPTISRSHADIINKNGQFYIVDNNSTNHTYVNGEMIPSNTQIPLSHGTKIRLSNEEFEFKTF